MEIKPGTIINHIEIEIRVNGKTKVTSEQYKILSANGDNCVIDDHNYSTIQFKKEKHPRHSILNNPKALESNFKIDFIIDYVRSYIYTTSNPIIGFKRCKKELEEFIDRRCIRYGALSTTLEGVELEEVK